MKLARIHLVTLFGVMVSLATSDLAAGEASATRSHPVKLPRIEVQTNRPDFEFNVQYDDISLKVQEVVVTWVNTDVQKRGLRVGDRMRAIENREVTTLSFEQLLAATKRELAPGESQSMVFTGTRALVRRVTVTYTTKGPNKAPEPTTTSVTPRATERESR